MDTRIIEPKYTMGRPNILQRYGLAMTLTAATVLAAAADQERDAYTLGGMTLAVTALSALRRNEHVIVRR